jgi:hypothetical protein
MTKNEINHVGAEIKRTNIPRRVFFLISWGGVRLSPLGTSVTIWPIVPAPDDR